MSLAPSSHYDNVYTIYDVNSQGTSTNLSYRDTQDGLREVHLNTFFDNGSFISIEQTINLSGNFNKLTFFWDQITHSSNTTDPDLYFYVSLWNGTTWTRSSKLWKPYRTTELHVDTGLLTSNTALENPKIKYELYIDKKYSDISYLQDTYVSYKFYETPMPTTINVPIAKGAAISISPTLKVINNITVPKTNAAATFKTPNVYPKSIINAPKIGSIGKIEPIFFNNGKNYIGQVEPMRVTGKSYGNTFRVGYKVMGIPPMVTTSMFCYDATPKIDNEVTIGALIKGTSKACIPTLNCNGGNNPRVELFPMISNLSCPTPYFIYPKIIKEVMDTLTITTSYVIENMIMDIEETMEVGQ